MLIIWPYTLWVMANHGVNLVSVIIQDITTMSWNGQFDTDFLMYLCLSGLWIAWRHRFSVGGCLVALICATNGMFFFAPYLLTISFQSDSLEELLLGQRA